MIESARIIAAMNNVSDRLGDLAAENARLQRENEALRAGLSALLAPCVEDFGEPDDWGDDEPVSDGLDSHSAFTFGHIRRARALLAESANRDPQSASDRPHTDETQTP